MRQRTLLVIAAGMLGLSGVSVVRSASQPTSQPAVSQPSGNGVATTQRPPSFERSMKAMGQSLAQISNLIDDPSHDWRVLELLERLQIATAQAKAVVPPEFAELPTEDEREAAKKDYRLRMIRILQGSLDMETAITNGDRPGVKAAMRQLLDQRRDGHEALGIDDDATRLPGERKH